MTYRLASIATWFAGLVLLSMPAAAVTIASFDATFTVCSIPENLLLQLPFVAIAGDAVLTDSGSTTVSDVFRIFNNVVNTGGGTGLGNMVFLYSSDDTSLPNPSTYSANAVFLSVFPSAEGAVLVVLPYDFSSLHFEVGAHFTCSMSGKGQLLSK